MQVLSAEEREIIGVACVIAGDQTFEDVRYRVRVVEKDGKRRLTGGIIDAAPGVVAAIHASGEAAIELGSVLGWFWFVVTDVPCGTIALTGWIKKG